MNNQLTKVLKKIYHLLDIKQKFRFVLIIFIMIISAILAQLTPKAIGWLTDDLIINNDISFNKIIPFLLFILFVNLINEVIKILRRVLVEDTATKTEKKARILVLNSLLKAPLSYFKENMTGNIHGRLNRCLDGTIQLEKLLFMDFVPAIFNGVAAIVTIFTTLPLMLALPMLLVIPIGVFVVLKQIKSQKGIRIDLLKQKAKMDGVIVELINGIEVIRITDSLDFESKRFENKSELLRSKSMKHHKAMAFYDLIKFINQVVFTVLIIGISTYFATINIISIGAVLTSYLCFTQLLKPLEELHRIFDEVSECTVLADDFFKMVDIECDFSYQLTYKKANNIQAVSFIEMQNINFKYSPTQDKLILENFNLHINSGTFLGVVGPSGCGKSSLIKIICKLEKTIGNVIIDNKLIDNLSRKEIASYIALVPQNPFLIAGSIYDNITYGIDREVSYDEVKQACERAFIYDFINGLDNKFDFVISEGGRNLSGGQRQRIAIARIFLRKPKILILDEATSALDNTAEKYIQNEIEKMQKENNMTIIAIAHRLTTLKNCDRIIVLDKGSIIQEGKFDNLVNTVGLFADMYNGKI